MSKFMYDLFVIGAGSGGVRGARIAAQHGARTAIAEEYRFGGTCVIRGCVPKKLLMYASSFSHEVEVAQSFGWHVEKPTLDWGALMAAKNKEIARLEGIYGNIMTNNKVEKVLGRAKIVDAHTVRVGDKDYTSEYILVATGSTPTVPEIPGSELFQTSEDFLEMKELPARVAIVGGGYIGSEFASILCGAGSQVSLFNRNEHILRGFDADAVLAVEAGMSRRGVNLRQQMTIETIEKVQGGFKCLLSDGTYEEYDAVFACTGRRPNTDNLGLEDAGVRVGTKGEVLVDAYSRSSVPNIYAVGDCTNRINLTPVALNEGHAFADTVFGGMDRTIDHANVASAVFTQPQLACVGKSEEEGAIEYGRVDVYMSTFRSMKLTLSDIQEKTLMKLVVEPQSQRIIGAHMVGDAAAEIMQTLAVIVKMGGTKSLLDATIGIHPSSAEEFVTMRTRTRVTDAPPEE